MYECNYTLVSLSVRGFINICKLALPPLTRTSSQIHMLTIIY